MPQLASDTQRLDNLASIVETGLKPTEVTCLKRSGSVGTEAPKFSMSLKWMTDLQPLAKCEFAS
jgi:hypothetical protein